LSIKDHYRSVLRQVIRFLTTMTSADFSAISTRDYRDLPR